MTAGSLRATAIRLPAMAIRFPAMVISFLAAITAKAETAVLPYSNRHAPCHHHEDRSRHHPGPPAHAQSASQLAMMIFPCGLSTLSG